MATTSPQQAGKRKSPWSEESVAQRACHARNGGSDLAGPAPVAVDDPVDEAPPDKDMPSLDKVRELYREEYSDYLKQAPEPVIPGVGNPTFIKVAHRRATRAATNVILTRACVFAPQVYFDSPSDAAAVSDKDMAITEALREFAINTTPLLLSNNSDDGVFPWVKPEDASGVCRPFVPTGIQLVTLMIKAWIDAGGVVLKTDETVAVSVFLPQLSPGNRIDNATRQVCIACTTNSAVYVSASMTIDELVGGYIETLRRLGFFDPEGDHQVFSIQQKDALHTEVVTRLVGDRNVLARPRGPPGHSELGLQTIGGFSHFHYGMGTRVMHVPVPITRDTWKTRYIPPRRRSGETTVGGRALAVKQG